MRYRLMATYRGVLYEAGVGPTDKDVVLFAACPPPEELGFQPAIGHWRKAVSRAEVDAVWESRPSGSFGGEPCLVLDDLGEHLHISYLGHDRSQAERLGYAQMEPGVFELLTAREDVTGITEDRVDHPFLPWQQAWPPATAGPGVPGLDVPRAAEPGPGGAFPEPAPEEPGPAEPGPAEPGPAEPGPTVPGTGGSYPEPTPGEPGADHAYPEPTAEPRADHASPGPIPKPGPAHAYPGSIPKPGPAHAYPEPTAEPSPAHAYPEPTPEPGPAHIYAAPTAESGAADTYLGPAAVPGVAALIPRRRRAASRPPRAQARQSFAELADLAAMPQDAYAVDEAVDGAICLVSTDIGFEVFSAADGVRQEVRPFRDEEAAYFYLFGLLAAEAVRDGRLVPPSR